MSDFTLTISEFGKFRQQSFGLGRVTVVHGANEAGKTTLIDAIMRASTRFTKKQSLYTDVLRPRYGEGPLPVRITRNSDGGEVMQQEHDWVRDLLVVRASELDIALRNASVEVSWLEALRGRLFTGGVNPQSIIDRVDAMRAKPQAGNGSPLFESNRIDKQLREIEIKLEGVRRELAAQSGRLKKKDELSSAAGRLSEERGELDRRVLEIEQRLVLQKTLSERRLVKEARDRLGVREQLGRELALNSGLSDATSSEIRELEAGLRVAQTHLATREEDLARRRAELQELRVRIEHEESGLSPLRADRDAAIRTDAELSALVSESLARGGARAPVWMPIVGAALLFGALAVGMNGLAGVAALLGVVLLVITFVRRAGFGASQPRANDPALRIRTLVRIYNQSARQSVDCPDSSFESAQDFLRRVIEKCKAAEASIEKLRLSVESASSDAARLERELSEAEKTRADSARKLSGLLPPGIADSRIYAEALLRQAEVRQRLNRLESELASSMGHFGAGTLEALRAAVDDRMLEILRDPIEGEAASLQQLQVWERELAGLRARRQEVSLRLQESERELAVQDREIQILIEREARQQVALEREAHALRSRRDALVLQMDSYVLLREIVAEIDQDSGQKFAVLGESIEEYFNALVGEARTIRFSGLSSIEEATCTDRAGRVSAVGQLSSGTRDAFIFAARLAFLKKILTEEDTRRDAFLILDDPFVLLDPARTDRALRVLQGFQKELGMNLVYLTKSSEARDAFAAVFDDAVRIEL